MKYDQHLHRSLDGNLSVRSQHVRWLTGAHIQLGVRRGRYLHGLAIRRGYLWLLDTAAAARMGIFRTIALWHDRARSRRHLTCMDDRFLHDIGLSRLDAKREINKPFWRE
jgi:uncharacterized protein YjiS (DUF1127 family)